MVTTFGAPGGMLKIRNPLHGLVLTILVSLVITFLGGFIGVLCLQFLLSSTGWEYVLALGLGAIAGLGGLITGKLGPRRARQDLETMLRTVRCARCGARVGLSAGRGWWCPAYLPPT